jgi:hypothetical protein
METEITANQQKKTVVFTCLFVITRDMAAADVVVDNSRKKKRWMKETK